MIHSVLMELIPGTDKIPLILGQEIIVYYEGEGEGMKVPMKVVRIYENGDFDGEVKWGES